MTPAQYEMTRGNYPHLRLPTYANLHQKQKNKLWNLTVDELIALRASVLLTREPGVHDYGVSPEELENVGGADNLWTPIVTCYPLP